MVKYRLAYAHGFRSYLHQFVGLDILKTLLKRQDRLRDDARLVVGARCTDIGKLLRLGDIYHEVVVMNMLTHNLSVVNILARVYEELASVLQLVYGICKGIARLESNHRTVCTAEYIALVWLILLETVRHNGFTLRCSEDIGTESHDTARRDVELDVHTLALRLHGGHLALAACHHVYHLGREFLWYGASSL